jgi:hypothetical protein
MASTDPLLGTSPRPVRLLVEAGKVAEFRAATGMAPDLDATHAPPTFPVVLEHAGPSYASVLSDQGIDLAHVLHGSETLRYPTGPLRVGDDLTGEMSVVGDETKQGSAGPLRLVTLRAELRRLDGEVAVVVDRVLAVVTPPA